jgi:hypothetical protein
MAIQSLESEDLFIFYYAGHGFHGVGGNRITAWDTHPFNVEDTTLLVRNVLRISDDGQRLCFAELAIARSLKAIVDEEAGNPLPCSPCD